MALPSGVYLFEEKTVMIIKYETINSSSIKKWTELK